MLTSASSNELVDGQVDAWEIRTCAVFAPVTVDWECEAEVVDTRVMQG
jgi:hypothetical protein